MVFVNRYFSPETQIARMSMVARLRWTRTAVTVVLTASEYRAKLEQDAHMWAPGSVGR
jgi:hypothetical protein